MNSVVLNDGAAKQSYAAENVRRFDHDRFLTAMFAPKSMREDLFALYAFNIEIAKIAEIVSEPLIGRMRLQWWRDTLDRLFAGELVAHEVARPLGLAIETGKLARGDFDILLDTREFDVEREAPVDMSALNQYALGTGAPLLALALQIAGAGQEAAANVSRSVGTAWALTGLLRAVPFHARQRRLFLPQDRLVAHSVEIQSLFNLKPPPSLMRVIQEIGHSARELLDAAPVAMDAIPKASRSPALIASMARGYLADLEDCGWDPFVLERRHLRPLAIARLGWRSLIWGY